MNLDVPRRKKLLASFLVTALLLVLTGGCQGAITNTSSATLSPSTQFSTPASSPSQTSPGTAPTVTPSASPPTSQPSASGTTANSNISLQLLDIGNRLALMPSSATQPASNGIVPPAYLYDVTTQAWVPAAYSAEKTDSLTGRGYRDRQASTVDLYRVRIGDFTGYTLIDPGFWVASVPGDILWRLVQGQPVLLPESADLPIVAIFDDIYAVVGDKLKMISSRSVGSFDYQTIDKPSVGDLFPWAWATAPVCSRHDNKIFYLSSRERAYYSIWVIDLDQQTESRFGEDVALELRGRSADHLIAVMNPNESSVDNKLIATSDPNKFHAFSEEDWLVACDWLYKQSGTTLILENGDVQLNIESSRQFRPFYIDDQIILLNHIGQDRTQSFLAIDPVKRQYSLQSMAVAGTLAEWQAFIQLIMHTRLDFAAAEAQGIKIK